ncbi:MAG TPA: HAD family hydrolase [Gemmatimonadales bacterium]|nr:HAD family hydrolase [Gemmatimonadales bacterium]HYT84398.1 HAD family hydrolase [Gemmatimonadales bacterium]
MRSEAILFDFGGTLDADGVTWGPRYHAAYRSAGGSLDYSSFDPLHRRSDEALARVAGIRSFGFRQTIDAQVRLLLELVPDQDGVDANRMADLFHREARATVERNRALLERLTGRYRLGIVSNFTGNLAPCLQELGLAHLFAAVGDSGVVGAAKPDPRIFLEVLGTLGVSAGRAWMVGDNFDADIRGAAGLGMRTCWLAPPHRAAPPGDLPTARIRHLPELEGVIG